MSVKVVVSVSGGRTSAYMAEWLIENKDVVEEYFGRPVEYIFVFANTGRENDDTLRFVNDVDRYILGNQLVWLEADINPQHGKGTRHRVVNSETAHHHDQYLSPLHPFRCYMAKYGVPNVKFKSCTRELKLRPIGSYLRSIGLKVGDYWTAIGIRDDEGRRVSPTAEDQNIFYPLVDLNPVDKDDVLMYWEDREYDLRIPEHRGNCETCFKKSFKKLHKVWTEDPSLFVFNDYSEKVYGMIGSEFKKHGVTEPRKTFRESRNTEELIALFREIEIDDSDRYVRDGGCSESCEMYDTEEVSHE